MKVREVIFPPQTSTMLKMKISRRRYNYHDSFIVEGLKSLFYTVQFFLCLNSVTAPAH